MSVKKDDFSTAEDNIKITRRRLPHWQMKGSIYYVTFRTYKITLSREERNCVLNHIIKGNKVFYILIATVVMPDHTHLLLTPSEGYSLSQIMKGIKGVSARKVNQMRNTIGTVWQDESYDRIIRDQKELDEKIHYMAKNPVKNGFTDDVWNYHSWYFNREWQTGMSAPPD